MRVPRGIPEFWGWEGSVPDTGVPVWVQGSLYGCKDPYMGTGSPYMDGGSPYRW